MAAYRWKSFNDDGDRPEKPRRYGVTEMKGPHYSLFSRGLLEDVFESMSQFVDGLKLCDGSHTSVPKTYIKEMTDMAHKHNVYVSSGDWADQMLRQGPSALKEYIEECKQLGFDTIELDVASLGLPEETLLRYVRLIKSSGLRAKPQFSVKFNKSDIAFSGDRAFGAYVIPAPQSSEMVEDVDLLVRRAERCLEAGADMIMINADDLCRQADLLRSDMVAKIVGRLGLDKTMFEASNPKISEWFVKRYGPKVNLFVDHSQLMDLECLRGRNLGQNHSSVLGRSEIKDVYDPRSGGRNLSKISTKKATTVRSGCSRSIANLKDVIHGSKRHMEKPPLQSPRSIGSSELLNPITHEVVLSNSTCELKITSCNFPDSNGSSGKNVESISAFMGTLKPGTPGPGGHHIGSSRKYRGFGSPVRKGSPGNLSRKTGPGFGSVVSRPKVSYGADSHGFSALTCHKCGEQFVKWEAVEAHHLSKHAVTELVEGDSSRKIVEIICRTSLSKPENSSNGIEKILKVHNMQKVLAQFEEYRELVKIKASKLAKKHPRCLADGNELLRFYGTSVECSLGINGSSSLCTSEKCKVCRILRHGFSIKKEINGGVGVFTASTSGRALEAIDENIFSWRKALIVCRVIAGRVHRPLENVQELIGQSGFDSLAGKVGLYSNIEELYLLNPKALLPCFVVICKS